MQMTRRRKITEVLNLLVQCLKADILLFILEIKERRRYLNTKATNERKYSFYLSAASDTELPSEEKYRAPISTTIATWSLEGQKETDPSFREAILLVRSERSNALSRDRIEYLRDATDHRDNVFVKGA